MGAIDLAPRPGAPGKRGYEAMGGLLRGGTDRANGGGLRGPVAALIVSAAQIGQIADTCGRSSQA
jgi:hypothetical protein